MQANDFLLNRIFSKNTINSLIDSKIDDVYFSVVRRYIEKPGDKNHLQIVSEIYKKLKKDYRNEYYYKNTILNNLLLKKHSLTNTTALTEVSIGKSKADFIMINGKAVVYEIKTELDNLERLNSQIEDYYKAFPNVNIITYEKNIGAINKKIKNSDVGIYILTNRNAIKEEKKAISNYSKLDSNIIFKTLRKDEYENILIEYYNKLPIVSQFKYYKECQNLFANIDINIAYSLYTKELKKRNKIDIELFAKVPEELKTVVYFSNFKNDDYNKLDNFLKQEFGG